MSETKTRRTITLPDGSKDDLAKIKTEAGLPTDVAAIADALKFRAKVADRRPDEVFLALSLYDMVRSETEKGAAVFCETVGVPDSKHKLFVPSFG